jgi:hypothetical protein
MRYFFDIRDDQLVPDEDGMILPDIEAAGRGYADAYRSRKGGDARRVRWPNGNRGPQPAWACS